MSAFVDLYFYPLLACLVLAGMHVYLGLHIVSRKVIFVDLALAQIAAFGALWAAMMGYDIEHDRGAVMAYSFAFSIAGALLFALTRSRRERAPHEAVIGIIYAAASAATLLLSAKVAHGGEAAKTLLGGRVDLVGGGDLAVAAGVCAAAAAMHAIFRERFLMISFDPEKAQAEGVRLRLWDFFFYLTFGVVITTAVTIAGVLLVFSYLVIPAVAALLFCERLWARLAFGWALAAGVTVAGTWVAWKADAVIAPTIVCGLAGVLAIMGVVSFVRSRGDKARALGYVAAFAALFGIFLGGTWAFRKPVETDEVARALDLIEHGEEVGNLKSALGAFERHPERREAFVPHVRKLLDHEDESVRELSLHLLGQWKDAAVLERLPRFLRDPRENVRRKAISVAKALDDPRAAPELVKAAAGEGEPDLKIEMAEAAVGLGALEGLAILAAVLKSPESSAADRHEAFDHLRGHLEGTFTSEADLPQWWEENRARLTFDPKDRKFKLR